MDDTTVATTTMSSTLASNVDNTCIICPNGATAGDDYFPEIEGNNLTCSQIIEFATESGSKFCKLASIVSAYCCPL
jgi:hypothetical protein